jgi:hypothetical protein
MDLQLCARKCSENLVRNSCNIFAVTADKVWCMIYGLPDLSLCVCVCVCVCVCISDVYLPLWAPNYSENLLLENFNQFAVTADKGPCVVDGLAGLSLCVCVCVCIYPHGLAAVGAQVQRNSRAWSLQTFRSNCRQRAVRGTWTSWIDSVCVCVSITNMDLQLWSRKCTEILVRGSCNHFAVTSEKGPFVVHGFAGLSVFVCVCVFQTWTCSSGCASAAKISCVVFVKIST